MTRNSLLLVAAMLQEEADRAIARWEEQRRELDRPLPVAAPEVSAGRKQTPHQRDDRITVPCGAGRQSVDGE